MPEALASGDATPLPEEDQAVLHVTLSTHRCVALKNAPDVSLTPAAYLRLRRKSAGVSIAEAARRITPDSQSEASAAELIGMLETDGATARYPETIDALRSVYPLDADVYFQLKDGAADTQPQICTGCGCSHWDPCVAPDDAGTCSWADGTTCTRCSGDAFPVSVYQ